MAKPQPPVTPAAPAASPDRIWYLFKHNNFIVYADDASIQVSDLNAVVQASFDTAKKRLPRNSLIRDVKLGELSYKPPESQASSLESGTKEQSEPQLQTFALTIQTLPKPDTEKKDTSPKPALSVSYTLIDERFLKLAHAEQSEYLRDLSRLFVLMNAASPLRDLREAAKSDMQVMPNWTFNANPSGACTTGGPGGVPTPPEIPYPYKDKPFEFLRLMKPQWSDLLALDDTPINSTANAQNGKKVRVIVLDSVPLKRLPTDSQRSELDQAIQTIETLQKHVNVVNPDNGEHPYLAFLKHMNAKDTHGKYQYIHWAEDFAPTVANTIVQELKSLEDLGDGHRFHMLNHDYEMRDHGLFIASIIESLLSTAPGIMVENAHDHNTAWHHHVSDKVEYHLIEVLNQYGVGTLQSLTAGLQHAISLIQQDTTIPTIINCSLMVSAHNDLGKLIVSGDQVTEGSAEPQTDSLLQQVIKLLLLMVEKYALDLQIAAAGRQAIVIASAGNRLEPAPADISTAPTNGSAVTTGTSPTDDGAVVTTAPDTRFPASSPHVIGVGALDADGNQADYSYKPDRPSDIAQDKTGQGVLAFGGDDVDPQQGLLGVYLDLYLHERDANILYTRELYGCAYWAGTSFAAGVTSALCAWLVLAGTQADDGAVYEQIKAIAKLNPNPSKQESPKIKLKKKKR